MFDGSIPDVESALRRAAIEAIVDKVKMRQLLRKLLDLVVLDGEEPCRRSVVAMKFLFQLCCSPDGTEVRVHPGKGSPQTTVLVLGFAGSSASTLKPVESLYTEKQGWRVISTCCTGLQGDDADKLVEEQFARIASLASSAERLVVHAMSNQGHATWTRLLHSRPSLANKVAALILDCAPSKNVSTSYELTTSLRENPSSLSELTTEALDDNSISERLFKPLAKTISGTLKMVFSTMMLEERKLTPLELVKARGPIEAGARALVAMGEPSALNHWSGVVRLDGLSIIDWGLKHEPPFPTLCLTSIEDDLIPPTEVIEWTDSVLKEYPDRAIKLVFLAGQHCLLINASEDKYSSSVKEFLEGVLDQVPSVKLHTSNTQARLLVIHKVSQEQRVGIQLDTGRAMPAAWYPR